MSFANTITWPSFMSHVLDHHAAPGQPRDHRREVLLADLVEDVLALRGEQDARAHPGAQPAELVRAEPEAVRVVRELLLERQRIGRGARRGDLLVAGVGADAGRGAADQPADQPELAGER